MKKTIFLAVLIINSCILQAQFKSGYTSEFDSIFSNISHTEATTGILYERVVPFAELYNFNSNISNNIDTSNVKHFLQAYFELYNATFLLPHTLPFDIDSLKSLLKENETFSNNPVVNIGILHYNFNMIDSTIAIQKLYFDTDSVVHENLAISASMYIEKTAFVASPLKKSIYSGTTHFHFNNHFKFDNTGNQITGLSVDFDDGLGMRQITNNLVTVIYTSSGKKTLRFEALLSNGDTLTAYATIRCLNYNNTKSNGSGWPYIEKLEGTTAIKAKITPSNPYTGGTFGITEGKVWIFYANSDKILRKPILIADGFDPINIRVIDEPDTTKGEGSIWNLLYYDNDTKHVGLQLLNLGYDLVFLDFKKGGIYIEQNAMVCIEAINEVNRRLTTSGSKEEIITMGPSMGGTITRYALAYMEKNPNANTNYGNHNCRLWASFAAPHQGANISFGAQAFLNFMGYTAGAEMAKEAYDKIVNCTSAR